MTRETVKDRKKPPSSGAALPEARQFKVKVCVVGEPAVGKTSLIRRYVFGEFDERRGRSREIQVSTRGGFVDLSAFGLTLSKLTGFSERGMYLDLLIWDILGQTRPLKAIHRQQFAKARGLLAVCDITRGETLDALDEWIEDVYDVTGVVPTILVGNKADLGDQAQIAEKELARAAWAYDCPFLFTSARTGNAVEATFQSIAGRIVLDILSRRDREAVGEKSRP